MIRSKIGSVFIYTLEDPLTGEIKYVGKTCNPLQRRKNHLNSGRDVNTHKRNWINKVRRTGHLLVFKILDEVPEQEWHFWEKYWINQFKVWGFNLVNVGLGGEGLTYGNQTSFRKGIIPWNTGTGYTNKCLVCGNTYRISPCSKDKIKCCSLKCGAVLKAQNPNKGCFKVGSKPWNTNSTGIKLKPDKNVYQYSALTGEFIQHWDTAKKASIQLGINEDSIGQCCRAKSKTAGGFIWSYIKTPFVTPPVYKCKRNYKLLNNLR